MTSPDPALATAVGLGTAVDALGALAAHLRLESEGLEADPAVRAQLARVAQHLLGEQVTTTSPPAVALARTFLRQASELVENPGRSGGWDQLDVPLLQAIGRMSGAIADAVVIAANTLDGLGASLASQGSRFLDLGTGTGWLAIAIARTHPATRVVGMDVWEPALNLARANVEAERLDHRVDLVLQDAATLDEPEGYDAIWVPLPFLPREIVPAVLSAAHRSLRPGGWVLPGAFTGTADPLSELLTDLRTMRSGGHPWSNPELFGALEAAGFVDAQEVPRTWPAPARLFGARLPG